MIKQLSDLFELSKKFNIPTEDILLIDININGINVNIEADRVRFYVSFFDKKQKNFFCALQVRKDSKYSIENELLYFEDKCIGSINRFEIDFCDAYYMRKNNTVLNINPKSRIECQGCKFCYTSHQKSRNTIDLTIDNNLEEFLKEWMDTYNYRDLSNLYQIAVVSGCFPDENSLISFLLELNNKSRELNFRGEIFYMGSQLQTQKALKKLKSLYYFSYCLTLECFSNREILLKKSKSNISIEQLKSIMESAINNNFKTNFSYIVGLDNLEDLKIGFTDILKYTNKFPIINILQEHQYQNGLRSEMAIEIEFYLKARKIIEEIYSKTNMKPTTWEVCRTLWYTTFSNIPLEQ